MKHLDLTQRALFLGFLILYSMEVLPAVAKTLLVIFLLMGYGPSIRAIFKADRITVADTENVIIALVILFLTLAIIGLTFWISIAILVGVPIVVGVILYLVKVRKSKLAKKQEVIPDSEESKITPENLSSDNN